MPCQESFPRPSLRRPVPSARRGDDTPPCSSSGPRLGAVSPAIPTPGRGRRPERSSTPNGAGRRSLRTGHRWDRSFGTCPTPTGEPVTPSSLAHRSPAPQPPPAAETPDNPTPEPTPQPRPDPDTPKPLPELTCLAGRRSHSDLVDHSLVGVDHHRCMRPLVRVDADHHHDTAFLSATEPQRASLIRVDVLSPLLSHATAEDTNRQTPR